MSVQGTFLVQESDDPRYVVGETYNVRLYADRSHDIDNQQAGPTSSPAPELPPDGETSVVVDDSIPPESSTDPVDQ